MTTKTKADTFTQGGQTQLHKLRMIGQVTVATLKASLWVFIIAFILLLGWDHGWQDLWFFLCYAKAHVRVHHLSNLPRGFWDTSWIYMKGSPLYTVQDHWVVSHPSFQRMETVLFLSILKKFSQSVGLGILTFAALSAYWVRQGQKKKEMKVLSGTSLVKPQSLLKLIKKQKLEGKLNLAEIPYILESETEHTLLVGTTGCGKTNAMNEMLLQLKSSRGKSVIVDTTGLFVQHFYNPQTDILLNPLDKRSASWNLWEECYEDYLFDNLAESMIPQVGNDPFWSNAARTVLSVASKKLGHTHLHDMQELLFILLNGSLKEVYPYFKGTAAASMMDPESEKTALSIRSTLSVSIKSFEYLREKGDESFSIRRWIQDPSQTGFLFLVTTPEQRSTLIPLMTAWISLASKAMMGKTNDQKVWFFIDELASLNQVPELPKALAEVRKYGGCFVLGIQTLSQIDDLYGQGGSRTICGLTGTKVIFRTPDSFTAKRMSEFLGEQEILESSESISFGAHQMRDGVSLSDRKSKQPLIPYTELMRLKNLDAFLQLPRDFPITKVTFNYHFMTKISDPFIPIKNLKT